MTYVSGSFPVIHNPGRDGFFFTPDDNIQQLTDWTSDQQFSRISVSSTRLTAPQSFWGKMMFNAYDPITGQYNILLYHGVADAYTRLDVIATPVRLTVAGRGTYDVVEGDGSRGTTTKFVYLTSRFGNALWYYDLGPDDLYGTGDDYGPVVIADRVPGSKMVVQVAENGVVAVEYNDTALIDIGPDGQYQTTDPIVVFQKTHNDRAEFNRYGERGLTKTGRYYAGIEYIGQKAISRAFVYDLVDNRINSNDITTRFAASTPTATIREVTIADEAPGATLVILEIDRTTAPNTAKLIKRWTGLDGLFGTSDDTVTQASINPMLSNLIVRPVLKYDLGTAIWNPTASPLLSDVSASYAFC